MEWMNKPNDTIKPAYGPCPQLLACKSDYCSSDTSFCPVEAGGPSCTERDCGIYFS